MLHKYGGFMHFVKKSIVFLTILMLIFINAKAQTNTTDEKSELLIKDYYFQSTSLFKCKIKMPQDYEPSKKYQLVIGLHGGGSNPNKFIKVWDEFDPINFIYAVPQGPYAWPSDNGLSYDWAMWPSKDDKGMQKASELIPIYLNDLVQELQSQFNLNSIFLMGFSQGAIFTYLTGLKRYNLFEGIICLSGPGIFEPITNPFTGDSESNWLQEKYLDPAKNLKVFIAHGINDKMVDYNSSLKSRDVLRQHGYDVTYYDFDGGHIINKVILKRIIEWLDR